MHTDPERLQSRVDRVLRDRIIPAIHRPVTSVEVQAWAVGGEPVPASVALGLSQEGPKYAAFALESKWGAPWDTTWFRLSGTMPSQPLPEGEDYEVLLDLGWFDHSVGFHIEGLVYLPDGTVLKALNPKNRWIPLSGVVEPGEDFVFFVEAASNPLLLEVPPFRKLSYSQEPETFEGELFTFRRAEICVYDKGVAALAEEIQVAAQILTELDPDSPRFHKLTRALRRALNVADAQDLAASAPAASAELAKELERPAHDSAHHLFAVGNAHIDTAWLWPIRETRRKVARTMANVAKLLRENPQMTYTMTSAQQFQWLKNDYPELAEEVWSLVKEGRITHVGGMWVEPDATMPSGESLARQLLYGQRYFKEQFGEYSQILWLPDSFGYNASLPQLSQLAQMPYFLTQKVSWNDRDTFPHHSFYWRGLDGSELLTHFPPSDTYGAEVTPRELALASRQYAEKAISDGSILLYGYGDGGGGPTREMLKRAEILQDIEGMPTITHSQPLEFFETLAAELSGEGERWDGELYLQLHRGTFTSQSETKRLNRQAEAMLRKVESAAARANLESGIPYPHEDLERLWKDVLVNQFHDILPGSSIGWVHDEAEESYHAALIELEALYDAVMTGCEITSEQSDDQRTYARVDIAENPDGTVRMQNDSLAVVISSDGYATSIVDRNTNRELVPAGTGFGKLLLMRDEPVTWDAWDIDPDTWESLVDIPTPSKGDIAETADGVSVDFHYAFGNSRATLTFHLPTGGSVFDVRLKTDWHERERLLKIAFPLDIRTRTARHETQFGYIERPVHTNTSWDEAQFEVCSHRYVHLIEPGYGVAIVNDATFGHSVRALPESGVEVAPSVLRGPMYPDETADIGEHTKCWRLVVTDDTSEVLDHADELNFNDALDPLVDLNGMNGAVRIAAQKIAEPSLVDQNEADAVIIRLWEAAGARATGVMSLDPIFGPEPSVEVVDLLEEPVESPALKVDGRNVDLTMRPFQVVTLKVIPDTKNH